jgi:2-phosphosulfolactate phosphatase
MKIEVILTPAELPALKQRELGNAVCVVFDVLRATSSFVTALHHGAKAVVPVSEISEALAWRQKQPGVLLGGERNGVKIRGDLSGGIDFDLGNSPREYTPEKVRGKTIVSTTTNGTRALRACAGAQTVLAASFLNLTATVDFIKKLRLTQVLPVCAGTHENTALEDVLAAGALCEMLVWWGETTGEPKSEPKHSGSRGRSPHQKVICDLSDSAEMAMATYVQAKANLAVVAGRSENARRLLGIPELRDDVSFCLQRDCYPLVVKRAPDGATFVAVV